MECDDKCVYELEIDTANEDTSVQAPRYLLDREFTNGKVAVDAVEYYYYPVMRQTNDEVAIILNKTNGVDAYLTMNIIADSIDGYKTWSYPTSKNSDVKSIEKDPKIPEVITTCDAAIENACSGTTTNCILLIGVHGFGEEDDDISEYSLIVHGGKQKLISAEPRSETLEQKGDMDYYWFANAPSGRFNPDSSDWAHYLGLNVGSEQQDVDMYISFGDGRLPTKDDYDYASKMWGADFIHISSTDAFWDVNPYNSKTGIFVVGLEAKTADSTYALQALINSQDIEYDITALTSGSKVENVVLDRGSYNVYQWYNWGARDFELIVDASVGTVEVFLNFQSDT